MVHSGDRDGEKGAYMINMVDEVTQYQQPCGGSPQSAAALIASIAFGVLSLLGAAKDDPNGLYITTAFLIAAFAPKALSEVCRGPISLQRVNGRTQWGRAARSGRTGSREAPGRS